MSMEVAEKVIKAFKDNSFEILDLTGGAPEMSRVFKYMIEEGSKVAKKMMTRSNLVVFCLDEYKDLIPFIRDHKVEIVASLPFYEKDRTDKQRGIGVYDDSIKALQMLNEAGYGVEGGIPLHLVYNPNGAYLPGSQAGIEKVYRAKLKDEYGIDFNDLYIIANNPIGRFGNWLVKSENIEGYMKKLHDAFNPATVQNVMCRDMISVDYDGTIYDCDFNLALGLDFNGTRNICDADLLDIKSRKIILKNHCYGCTAGAGSSCGGEIE